MNVIYTTSELGFWSISHSLLMSSISRSVQNALIRPHDFIINIKLELETTISLSIFKIFRGNSREGLQKDALILRIVPSFKIERGGGENTFKFKSGHHLEFSTAVRRIRRRGIFFAASSRFWVLRLDRWEIAIAVVHQNSLKLNGNPFCTWNFSFCLVKVAISKIFLFRTINFSVSIRLFIVMI